MSIFREVGAKVVEEVKPEPVVRPSKVVKAVDPANVEWKRKLKLDGNVRGGKVGGPARAKALSSARRSEIARLAAQARWGK